MSFFHFGKRSAVFPPCAAAGGKNRTGLGDGNADFFGIYLAAVRGADV